MGALGALSMRSIQCGRRFSLTTLLSGGHVSAVTAFVATLSVI
jgi:hypothetical protein